MLGFTHHKIDKNILVNIPNNFSQTFYYFKYKNKFWFTRNYHIEFQSYFKTLQLDYHILYVVKTCGFAVTIVSTLVIDCRDNDDRRKPKQTSNGWGRASASRDRQHIQILNLIGFSHSYWLRVRLFDLRTHLDFTHNFFWIYH